MKEFMKIILAILFVVGLFGYAIFRSVIETMAIWKFLLG